LESVYLFILGQADERVEVFPTALPKQNKVFVFGIPLCSTVAGEGMWGRFWMGHTLSSSCMETISGFVPQTGHHASLSTKKVLFCKQWPRDI